MLSDSNLKSYGVLKRFKIRFIENVSYYDGITQNSNSFIQIKLEVSNVN